MFIVMCYFKEFLHHSFCDRNSHLQFIFLIVCHVYLMSCHSFAYVKVQELNTSLFKQCNLSECHFSCPGLRFACIIN